MKTEKEWLDETILILEIGIKIAEQTAELSPTEEIAAGWGGIAGGYSAALDSLKSRRDEVVQYTGD
jgi:hypothetical protein